VRRDGLRVRVSRAPGAASPAAVSPHEPGPAPSPAASAAADALTINAPLTGIFYRSTSPEAAPFVQAGSVVSVGDVVGLIEAMKLFNEIKATAAGRVKRVVAESGKLVRAHQPLIELER